MGRGRVPTTCLDCGLEVRSRTRCTRCDKLRDKRRNALPHRQAYRDPIYRSIVVSGLCYWGCGRAATTRDHKIRLIDGGTNAPSNIVSACGQCNYGRGANTEGINYER